MAPPPCLISRGKEKLRPAPQHTHTHLCHVHQSEASPSLIRISFQGTYTSTPRVASPAPQNPHPALFFLPPILPHHPHPTLSQTMYCVLNGSEVNLRKAPHERLCTPQEGPEPPQGPGPVTLSSAWPVPSPSTESLALGMAEGL